MSKKNVHDFIVNDKRKVKNFILIYIFKKIYTEHSRLPISLSWKFWSMTICQYFFALWPVTISNAVYSRRLLRTHVEYNLLSWRLIQQIFSFRNVPLKIFHLSSFVSGVSFRARNFNPNYLWELFIFNRTHVFVLQTCLFNYRDKKSCFCFGMAEKKFLVSFKQISQKLVVPVVRFQRWFATKPCQNQNNWLFK